MVGEWDGTMQSKWASAVYHPRNIWFEKEESILARDIFAVPEKMALVFNYMDLFFQTQPISTEESFKKAAAFMQKLRKYYDRKCLSQC